MTPIYYLHNNKLFHIDRMPPEREYKGHPEACHCSHCGMHSSKMRHFRAYLSTLQPIPHELKGEGIQVEGKDFEWRYEMTTWKKEVWYPCSIEAYNNTEDEARRLVAVPIEAKEEKCGVCGKEGGGHYINCTEHFRGGRSQTPAPHQQPAKETMLEQLADLLKKYDVRKYLNLNDSGYSQVKRDIVDLFTSQHGEQETQEEIWEKAYQSIRKYLNISSSVGIKILSENFFITPKNKQQ